MFRQLRPEHFVKVPDKVDPVLEKINERNDSDKGDFELTDINDDNNDPNLKQE